MKNKKIMLQTILVTVFFLASSTFSVSISLPEDIREINEDRINELKYSYKFTEPIINKITIYIFKCNYAVFTLRDVKSIISGVWQYPVINNFFLLCVNYNQDRST